MVGASAAVGAQGGTKSWENEDERERSRGLFHSRPGIRCWRVYSVKLFARFERRVYL